MDFSVSSVMEGAETFTEAGERLLAELIDVASGKRTKAEISGYTSSMDIYMVGRLLTPIHQFH